MQAGPLIFVDLMASQDDHVSREGSARGRNLDGFKVTESSNDADDELSETSTLQMGGGGLALTPDAPELEADNASAVGTDSRSNYSSSEGADADPFVDDASWLDVELIGDWPPRKRPRHLQVVGGTEAYHNLTRGLPPGPASIAELADWPQYLFEKRFGRTDSGSISDEQAVRRQRVESLFENGCISNSEFSGRLGAEVMMNMMVKCWVNNGLQLDEDSFVHWRCCDNNSGIQKMYKQAANFQTQPHYNGAKVPLHAFKGLVERLGEEERAIIASLRPATFKKGGKVRLHPNVTQEQAKRDHENLDFYLESSRHKIFNPNRTSSTCVLHPGKECPISFQQPADVPSAQRPIMAVIGGPMCLPYTSFGKNVLGLAHPSTESLLVYTNDVAVGTYDLATLENSANMPVAIFQSKVEKHNVMKVVSCTFGPEDGGSGANRTRLMATALKNESILWVGPDTPDGIQEDFMQFFQARAVIEADIFVGLDSRENVEKTRREYANSQGVYGDISNVDFDAFLSPSYGAIYKQFANMQADGSARIGTAGGFVADFTQDPAQGYLRCGPWMPTLACSSQVACFSKGSPGTNYKEHIFTHKELDLSQGWPTIAIDGAADYCQCIPINLEALSTPMQRRLRGNSMHLYALGAWFQYVASNCIRRDRFYRLAPPLLFLRGEALREDVDDDLIVIASE